MTNKAYIVHSIEDMNHLMETLEGTGFLWSSGVKPSEWWSPYFHYPIVIYAYDSDVLGNYLTYSLNVDDIDSDADEIIEYRQPMDFRWTKKPIVVEAFQWTGNVNRLGELEWIVEAMYQDLVNITHDDYGNPILLILTQYGEMMAKQGDYIIKGIKGELYPCYKEVFLATYER